MSALNKLTLEAITKINKTEVAKHNNKKLINYSKFLAAGFLVLSSLGHEAMAGNDKYILTKILGAGTAIEAVSGDVNGAKKLGGATIGAAAGAQLGGGKTAPIIGSILGAFVGGAMATNNIDEQNPKIQTQKQVSKELVTNEPNIIAPTHYSNVTSTVLYKITGGQNFYVTSENSPAVQYLLGNSQGEFKKLSTNLVASKSLNQAFNDYQNAYLNMEQSGVNIAQFFEKEGQSLYEEEQKSKYDVTQADSFVRQQNIQTRLNIVAQQRLKLHQLSDEFSRKRSDFFRVADNAVIDGYDISQYSQVLQMIEPSQNMKKMVKEQSFKTVDFRQTNLKIK